MLKDFILTRKMAPGAVINYGTKNFQETLVIGNRQEVTMKNGLLVPSRKKMTEDTIFDLASCTKLFTAIATLKLVEQRQINLSDDITKYAPQFTELKGTTIYDLLTFEPLATKDRVDKAGSIEEAEQILFTAYKKEMSYGSNIYNDFAPMVLKYAIEKASGMKYEAYLLKEVLKDLDMKNTFVQIPEEKKNKVANGNYDGRYFKDGNFLIRTKAEPGISTDDKARVLGQPMGILSGHAGLFTNVEDMTKLQKALIENKILSLDTREYMAKNKSGFVFQDDQGRNKYSQYLGMLCYSKNPNLSSSEVHHPLSGRSFASAGWSGTQQTIDPINGINFTLLSNRSHNRMTFIDKDQKDKVVTKRNGMKTIVLPGGIKMIDATRYAWDRDDVIHKCIELALQYKMLEDITEYQPTKEQETTLRKIK